jgi:predicted nucleic acid-binding protein
MLVANPIVLDADTLSHLAWAKRMDIIQNLLPGRMVILPEVIDELKRTEHIYKKAEVLLTSKAAIVDTLDMLGDEGQEFNTLYSTDKFGKGESASMAYARYRGCTLMSNNMRDVRRYCETNQIPILGVSGILYQSFKSGYISQAEAENIWSLMINKRRKLPVNNFNEVINGFTNGKTSCGKILF